MHHRDTHTRATPTTPGDASVLGYESLNPFVRGMLSLSAQPHTRFLGSRAMAPYNASHLLCARRGVVTGTKNRFFTSRADAWMFRYYAYDYAGLLGRGVLPHAHRPPTTITLLTREVGALHVMRLHVLVRVRSPARPALSLALSTPLLHSQSSVARSRMKQP